MRGQSITFEELLTELGSFGRYQIRVFVLVSALEAPAAWLLLQHIIAVFPPCAEYNQTTSNNSFNKDNCSSCQGGGSQASIITEFNLDCENAYIIPRIMSIQMTGVLFGACFTGIIADRWGRRYIFFVVYILLLLFGFLSAFANTWEVYTIIKFFLGFFFGGTLVVNFVLPLEFVGKQWRTFCGCIGFWALGVMSLSLFAYYIQNWRHLAIVTALCGVPLIFTWWWVPESPRWLIQHGRYDEANEILQCIAKCNKRQPIAPDVLERLVKGQQSPGKSTMKREESMKYSYMHLVKTVPMFKNTCILVYLWFICCHVYYGTSLSIGSLSGNRYLNFFLSGLVEIPPLLLVISINNKIGRRKTECFLLLVTGFSLLAVLVVELTVGIKAQSTLTTALFLLGRAGIAGSWAAAQIFTAEIFPTVVRNMGVGVCSMGARVGGMTASFVVSLNATASTLPFVIFGTMALLGGFLTLLLPETVNKPLPDTLSIKRNSIPLTTYQVSESHQLMNQEETRSETIKEIITDKMVNEEVCVSKEDIKDENVKAEEAQPIAMPNIEQIESSAL